MLPEEIVRELPLMNLTHWSDWTTDLPVDALRFVCDVRQSQAPDTGDPLTRVDEIIVQGQTTMRYIRKAFDETIGLIVDFYIGGEQMTCTEPQPGECIRCRQATEGYFSMLEKAYVSAHVTDASATGEGRPRHLTTPRQAFWRISVLQPARLSWICAFTSDGHFMPKAFGMSYDINDFFYLVERAMRESGTPLGADVAKAREHLEGVIASSVHDFGLRAENAACGWREGCGPSAKGIIERWSSASLSTGEAADGD